MVTSSHTITMFARVVLDDVTTGVSRFVIVSEVLGDMCRPVSPGRLRMNRGLSLVSGGLDRLEAELSSCCMAAVSRSSRISSRAKTGGSTTRSSSMR
jgi:hypothetical protein